MYWGLVLSKVADSGVFLKRNYSEQFLLTLQVQIPQNSQVHSNNSSAIANELFKCV